MITNQGDNMKYRRVALAVGVLAFALPSSAFAHHHGHAARKHHHSDPRKSANVGARGPQGPGGPQGPAGPAGPAGPSGASTVVYTSGNEVQLCPFGGGECDVGASVAQCPPNTHPIGGGWEGLSDPPVGATVAFNAPVVNSANNGWAVLIANDAPIGAGFVAKAVCAS